MCWCADIEHTWAFLFADYDEDDGMPDVLMMPDALFGCHVYKFISNFFDK